MAAGRPAAERVLVAGASRGIGFELARQARAAGAAVVATARDDGGATRLRALGATVLPLDVTDAASCAAFARALEGGRFTQAWYVAGVYGPRTAALDAPSQADFDRVMHANVLGAMRLLPLLGSRLADGGRLAVLSSKMGSIGARRLSSGWLYRASKAALNSVLKDTAIALQGRAIAVVLHPGWVRTDMGGAGADLDVAASVARLRRTVAALVPADNGGFFDHDATPLPW